MISVSYLFEGKINEHFKRNIGKYALGTAALIAAIKMHETPVLPRNNELEIKGVKS